MAGKREGRLCSLEKSKYNLAVQVIVIFYMLFYFLFIYNQDYIFFNQQFQYLFVKLQTYTKTTNIKVHCFINLLLMNQQSQINLEFYDKVLSIIKSACIQMIEQETLDTFQESLDEDNKKIQLDNHHDMQLELKPLESNQSDKGQNMETDRSKEGRDINASFKQQVNKDELFLRKRAIQSIKLKNLNKRNQFGRLKDENRLNKGLIMPKTRGKKVIFDEIITVKIFNKNQSPSCVRQTILYYEGINYSQQNLLINNFINDFSINVPQKAQENKKMGKKATKAIKIGRRVIE